MVRSLTNNGKARKVAAAKPKSKPHASKKKQASKSQVERGTLDLFSDVEQADVKYILKSLAKSPQLVPWLASLMRDGALEQVLRRKLVGEQPAELGRRLGDKVKRFRNLAPRFWNLLWVSVFNEPPSTEKRDRLTLEQHQALAEWALRVKLDGPLLGCHKSSGFEGPLLAVFKARHEQCGRLLADVTPAKVQAFEFGTFVLGQPFDGSVSVRGHAMQIEVCPKEKAEEAEGWFLIDNTNRDAALISDTLGFSQNLFVLVRKKCSPDEFAKAFPEYDDTFEIPSAADRFPCVKSYDDPARDSRAGPSELPVLMDSSCADTSIVKIDGLIVSPLKKRRSLEHVSTP